MRIGRNSNKNKISIPIRKASDTPCHTSEENLNCLKEHFEQALNFPPGTHSPDLEEVAHIAVDDVAVRMDPPSFSEVSHAVRKLKNVRVAECDNITAELLKCAETPICDVLHWLFINVWNSGHVPAEWKNG